MVATFLPATADSGVWHERTGWPSMCTVHAPHSAAPQPNLVPVRPSSSRTTHSSGVSGSACEATALPLRLKFTAIGLSLLVEAEPRRHVAEVQRVNPQPLPKVA